MSTAKHYDIALIGCGGAGMCLLWACMQSKLIEGLSILVLEPETKNKNDRTWCFWAQESDAIYQDLKAVCSHSWTNNVFAGLQSTLDPYRYQHLESSAFYSLVLDKAKGYPQIHFRKEAVCKLQKTKEGTLQIETQEQKQYSAHYVFDSRLKDQDQRYLQEEKERVLKQSFFAYQFRFPKPCFQANTIHMMNFDIEQNGSCQFVYILPYSETEAFIEFTRFGKSVLSKERDSAELFNWVHKNFGDYISSSYVEEGVIPMSLRFRPAKPFHAKQAQHIHIGTAAGALKPSTGYAFRRMYEQAFAILRALEQKKPLPTQYQTRRFAFYDSLLLDILLEQPERGKDVFNCLFQAVDINRILLFLSEETNIWQEKDILWVLPKGLFLKALWKKIRSFFAYKQRP